MEIIYIAGNGRSGSTILAMLLGEEPLRFCAGELSFIARSGISEEPCSCGATVGDCETWTRIMAAWESSRPVSLARFSELRHQFDRIKSLPRLVLNLFWPGSDFLEYTAATESLFKAIKDVTGATTIIDSSKSPARILILRRFSKLSVIHLCRNFRGVANSFLRSSPKDVERGLEADNNPVRPHRTLVSWVMNNLLTSLTSIGLRRCRLHFRDLVNGQFNCLLDLGHEISVPPNASFSVEHMFAGNKLRLHRAKLDPARGFRYERLTASQLCFASRIDKAFWFWAKH